MPPTHDHSHDHGHEAHHHHDHGGHDHGAEGHSHAPRVTMGNEHRVLWALSITAIFMVVEIAGGILSGSLALIADAGHMLTDVGALGLSWVAFRLARRPADSARSYGYARAETLAAFVNGLAMIALSIWIVVEAVNRLRAPESVLGPTMMAVAIAGLIANLVSFRLLNGGGGGLNMRGASLHVLGDMLGSVAAIAAAGVIIFTGWMPIDPLLSVLVALLVLKSAWDLTRDSVHILMEGAPSSIDPRAIEADLMAEVPGVSGIHHVHSWSLTSERAMVTLHATIAEGRDSETVLHAIQNRLKSRFGVDHATVQIEHSLCPDHASEPNW
ncbi:MAG: cation diffusion facilitator family transporter [Parvibaculaceae bacterium]|nr:cation diffusion facilitator family transporter [Parvibaculaceae bacterium]